MKFRGHCWRQPKSGNWHVPRWFAGRGGGGGTCMPAWGQTHLNTYYCVRSIRSLLLSFIIVTIRFTWKWQPRVPHTLHHDTHRRFCLCIAGTPPTARGSSLLLAHYNRSLSDIIVSQVKFKSRRMYRRIGRRRTLSRTLASNSAGVQLSCPVCVCTSLPLAWPGPSTEHTVQVQTSCDACVQCSSNRPTDVLATTGPDPHMHTRSRHTHMTHALPGHISCTYLRSPADHRRRSLSLHEQKAGRVWTRVYSQLTGSCLINWTTNVTRERDRALIDPLILVWYTEYTGQPCVV
jgi:hypothetical protein